MKLRQLESALQEVEGFSSPKWALEQYATPAHLAARVLWAAGEHGDIEGQRVLDLGCGTGMLSVAAGMMGAQIVCGLDADPEALQVAVTNLDAMELEADLIQADVVQTPLPFVSDCFDTVLMNPPFGTKNQGVDVAFLRRALQVAPTVYSLHKSSTREFLVGKFAKSLGCDAEVFAAMRFDLPATYKFHKKKSVDIEVDLIRFTRAADVERDGGHHEVVATEET